MKNIIGIWAIFFFIIGCDSNDSLEKKEVKEKITNELQIRNEIAYLPNSDESFTGKYERYGCGERQKNAEVNYRDGKVNGLLITWYCDGKKWVEANYINGNINGLFTEWWHNVQKNVEANAINGKLNGLCTEWWLDGQKMWEENYINGYLNGEPNHTGACENVIAQYRQFSPTVSIVE